MVENIASNSGDICSDNDFENESLLKLYLTPRSMYSKNGNSQKNSVSETLEKERIAKKIEELTYLDLRKSEEDELKYFIDFPLKYNGTIYQCPIFAKLSLTDQVKLLCSYHTKISKNISNQAKLQLECAPLPKLIKVPANYSNISLNDLEMDIGADEIKDNNNINSFDALLNSSSNDYISKSGRITKRKFYSESDDIDKKKHKVQDGDWLSSKKTSPTSKASGCGKKLPLEADNKNLDTKTISKKNLDIISRSPLFKEKDQPKNQRWSKIVEGLKEQKSKGEEEAAELEEFNKTLSITEETTEYDSSVRRRVVPPPLKPKFGKLKKQKEQYAELELTTQKAQIKKSTNVKSNTPKKTDSVKNEVSASTSNSVQRAARIQCPICSRDFKNTEIEEHASSCGDENRVETRSNSSLTMSCRFCDEVFLLDGIYEEHVKTCAKRSFK